MTIKIGAKTPKKDKVGEMIVNWNNGKITWADLLDTIEKIYVSSKPKTVKKGAKKNVAK